MLPTYAVYGTGRITAEGVAAASAFVHASIRLSIIGSLTAWAVMTSCQALAESSSIGTNQNWPSHNGDADETGYSNLAGITPRNIGRVGLAWSLDLPGERSLEATPLAINGRLYFTGSYSTVYCVDARSGRLLWKHDPEIHKHAPWRMRLVYAVSRGPAFWKGTVFTGTLDGRLLALDADTGKYIWHYQVNPREAWDYKATATMIVATVPIDGKPRRVLMQSPTNGFFYVLDRETGKLLSAEKIGKVTWAERIDPATGRPVEMANARYESGPVTIWPSPYGAHNWQTMTYNPRTGLVYIPYMQLGARYVARTASNGASGQSAARTGGVLISPVIEDADDGTGALLAWGPVAQKARWKVKRASIWNGGTMTTAGELVFQGSAEGMFEAYDAATGERRWSFDAKLGIVAAPITYFVDGRQQVSVLVGYGGASGFWSSITNRGWKYGLQPRRLLTFVLNGKARLPPTAPADFSIRAVDAPQLVIDHAAVTQGASVYGACAMCHGSGLLSAGSAPDLRESAAALDLPTLKSIVQQGTLLSRGMPQFSWLTDDQIHSLYMYIRSGAREALGRNGHSSESADAARF